jgi:hypothetical protein
MPVHVQSFWTTRERRFTHFAGFDRKRSRSLVLIEELVKSLKKVLMSQRRV